MITITQTPINKNLLNKSIEYHSLAQILELFKLETSEEDYFKFLSQNVKNTCSNISLERMLIKTITKNKLLEMIKNFNSNIYSKICNIMIENII